MPDVTLSWFRKLIQSIGDLLSQVRKLMPGHMRDGSGRRRQMHVTCAMFSNTTGEIVATYNDEVRSHCCSLKMIRRVLSG